MRRLSFLLLVLLLAACRPTTDPLPTAAPTLPPPPEPLTLGDTVTGTLTLENRIARWSFAGTPGLPLLADVTGTGGTLGLALLDPTGTELASGTALDVTLPIPGVYVLRVQLTAGEQADYTLTVAEKIIATATPTLTPTPSPTPDPFINLGTTRGILVEGQSVFGAFNTAGEEHLYTFEGTANTYVRAEMRGTSGAVDPVLTLYGPGGNAIAIDDNSGGGTVARLNGIQLPQTGVYGIIASGEGGAGGYDLTFARADLPFPVTPDGADVGVVITPTPAIVLTPTPVPGVNGNRLDDHVPVSGALGRPGAVDRYTIQANVGDMFTVAARATGGGLQPIIEMTSPSGAVVARGDTPNASGEVVIHSYEVGVTGAYVIFISGGSETTGRYELSYGRGATHSVVRVAEPVPGETFETTMQREAVRHEWFLRLNVGDTISAGASSGDGAFDPVLELVDPNGGRVVLDDNSGGGLDAQLFSVRVPMTGVYRLRVTAADPTQTGVYRLAWRYIQAVPTPTPPLRTAPLFTVDDMISPDAPRTYPLQGYTGERVVIEVEAAVGSGLDTLVELVTAEGVVFASDDDSGGDLNPRLVTELPANGVYTVRVSVYNDGNNTGGPFTLRVRRGY
jgi:hypothetical protein